jgi:hypothetical protein
MFARILVVAVIALLLVAVVARASSGGGGERRYVVRPADTLWSIAARHYGGDPREAVWRLQKRNGLDGALLVPGQELVLP